MVERTPDQQRKDMFDTMNKFCKSDEKEIWDMKSRLDKFAELQKKYPELERANEIARHIGVITNTWSSNDNVEKHFAELEKFLEANQQEIKIADATRLLSTVLCAFDTKQELIDWSIAQQNTFITYMTAVYFLLTDGKYERFHGDSRLGSPIDGTDISWG